MLQRVRIFILCAIVCVSLIISAKIITAQDNITDSAITIGLSVGDVPFSYRFPSAWHATNLSLMDGRGGAIILTEKDELGLDNPIAVITLSLAESAIVYPIALKSRKIRKLPLYWMIVMQHS